MVELDTIRTTVELEDQVSKGLSAISDHFSNVTKAVDALSKEMAKSDAAFKETIQGLTGVKDKGEEASTSLSGLDGWLKKIGVADLTPTGAALGVVTAAAGAAVIAVGATAAAVVHLTTKAADLGDELLTLHNKTDISVEALSAYRYVASQTGVEFTTITSGVQMLTKGLGEGTDKITNAISKLGLDLNTLRNSKPEEAFNTVIEALKGVPNAADRAAIGAQLFRGKFREIAALTKEDLKGMIAEFKGFGGEVTEEMARAGDAFNDAKAKLEFMFESVQVQLGAVFLPAATAILTEFAEAWNETRKKMGGDTTKMIELVGDVAEFFIESAGFIIKSVGQLTFIIGEFFTADFIKDNELVKHLTEVGQKFAKLGEIISVLQGNKTATELFRSMGEGMKTVGEFADGTNEVLKDFQVVIAEASAQMIIFGNEVSGRAKGAVDRVTAAIKAASETTDKAGDDFEGLGAKAAKGAEKMANAFKKVLEDKTYERLIDKYEKEQRQMMERTGKAIAELFHNQVDDAEEADRTLRRLTESRAQFEIGELQRQLNKQRQYYDTLALLGVDTSRALEAANKRTAASMIAVVVETEEFKEALGKVFTVLGPLNAGFVKGVGLLNETSDAFDDATEAANDFKREMADLGEAVVNVVTDALRAGDGLEGVLKGLGGLMGDAVMHTVRKSVEDGIKNGTMTAGAAFATTAGAAVGVAFMGMWVDTLIELMNQAETAQAAREAGHAAAAQFAAGFGGFTGMRRAFRQMGIDADDPAFNLFGASSPEQFQEKLARVTPIIEEFKARMAGLGKAADGVNTLMDGVAMSFANSMKEQTEALEATQKAHIEAMKAGGASAEQIAKDNELFAESMKTHTFEATEAQIAAFNRVGTIAGGVIANMVNQTGDLVGAVLSVGPALEQMIEMRDKFGLGDQVNAATAEVLKLYETFKNNEDVFTSISGVGQIMEGLGDALVRNSDLANAFGGQLAADFATLQARGVDVNVALAAMAPQLQELWELQKDGRITVDATTQALLDQAEAAGMVGDVQRDVNEKILGVLTEIKELIGLIGNVALPRMGTAADQAGRAVNRAVNDVAGASRNAVNAVRDVNKELGNIKPPDPIDITIRAKYDEGDMPDWWYDQGTRGPGTGPPNDPTTHNETPSFARGSGGFRDFGSGTLAMLHGRERVQTESDYMREQGHSTIVVEVEGEAIVAANVRNHHRYTRIRAGTSPRTVR